MKLKQIEQNKIIGANDFGEVKFRVSSSSTAVIMDLLSKGFYQNPIESIVREYASNAWDSHIEAGCEDEAIIVNFARREDNYFIEFIDFGTGMSPEKIQETFTVYFESDKRDTNEKIGSFGLGSKSGYAYTQSFFVITTYNLIEYTYLMSKDEYGISTLLLINEEPTSNGNGTTIRIPMKNTRSSYYNASDMRKFYDACQKQLLYFNNVYIRGCDEVNPEPFNKGKVYRFKHFTFSSYSPYRSMHLKLGQCVYQIPWTDLGKSVIDIPVAVNFEIGELMPTPNREGIILNDEAKGLILERINLATEEILQIFKKQVAPIENWVDWYKMILRRNTYHDHITIDTGVTLSITALLSSSKVPIQLAGVSSTIDSQLFLNNWRYARKIKNVLTTIGDDEAFKVRHLVEGSMKIYTITGDYNKYTNKYLSTELHPYDTVWILKASKIKLFSPHGYAALLNLYRYPKSEWRQRIVEYQKLVSSIWNSLPSYDKIQVPKEWIRQQYKERTKRDLNGMVVLYKARIPDRASENWAAYDKETIKAKDLVSSRRHYIYGSKADRDLLDKVFMLVRKRPNITVMYTAESNHEILEELDMFTHVSKFDTVYNRYFAQTVTAYMFTQYVKEQLFFFDNKEFIVQLKESVVKDMVYMEEYVSKHWNSGSRRYYGYGREPDEFFEACWHIAKENKLYDHEAVAVFKRVWDFVDKASPLKLLKTDGKNVIDPEAIHLARKAVTSFVDNPSRKIRIDGIV